MEKGGGLGRNDCGGNGERIGGNDSGGNGERIGRNDCGRGYGEGIGGYDRGGYDRGGNGVDDRDNRIDA